MKLIYVNWLIRQTSSNTLCIKTKVENFRRGPGFLRSRIGTAMNIVSSDMRDVRDTDCCLPEQKRIPSIQENLFCELLKIVCYHHHYPGWLSNMFLGISFSKFYDPLLSSVPSALQCQNDPWNNLEQPYQGMINGQVLTMPVLS